MTALEMTVARVYQQFLDAHRLDEAVLKVKIGAVMSPPPFMPTTYDFLAKRQLVKL